MITCQHTRDEDGGTVPVACRLAAADLAAQSGRWERLAARAMTKRARAPPGRFVPGFGWLAR